jgi:AcrR family transcriptional regulator
MQAFAYGAVMVKKNDKTARPRGRPRTESAEPTVLNATYRLVAKKGFRDFSVEDVVHETGIAKTTIYRRWPSKSALVMSAVLAKIESAITFASEGSFEDRFFSQVRNLAKVFRGNEGRVIASVIGAAQNDPDLSEAVLKDYLKPRREAAYSFFKAAQERGEIAVLAREQIEAFIDVVYGGLYFRLLLGHAPILFEDLEPWIRSSLRTLVIRDNGELRR